METVPEQETEQTPDSHVNSNLLVNPNTSPSNLQLHLELMEIQAKQHKEMEEARRNHERQMEIRRAKNDMVKVATDTLTSNAKSKPVDDRDVTATDIKTFADELIQYINQE